MIILLLLLLIFYAMVIFSWPAKQIEKADKKEDLRSVSLIIPFRNESQCITALLNAISSIEYHEGKLEILLIDDHSLDSGPHLVKNYLKNSVGNIRLIQLEHSKGKKAALVAGIKEAKGNWIVTTDADCVFSPHWLSTLLKSGQDQETAMICGPVLLRSKAGILNSFQQIDQAILMQMTESYIRSNRAIMANGANMAFQKRLFNEAFLKANKSSSGDDIFLLHAMKKNHLASISFCNDPAAIVYTEAKSSISSFIKQRLRWASKARYYKDRDTIWVGAIISLTCVCLLTLLALSLAGYINFILLITFFLAKLTLETFLLIRSRKYLALNKLWLYIPFYSLIHPFYSIGIALLSLLYKPRWKGRTI